VIAIDNARLLSELRQSLELQSATADVLRIISSSSKDLRTVFDAIAENAARLCQGFDVYVQLREGDLVRYVAHYGGVIASSVAVSGTRPLTRDLVIGRAMLESRVIHLLDAQTESKEFPEGSAIARRTGRDGRNGRACRRGIRRPMMAYNVLQASVSKSN
jgi:two-component system, NtrC family, sensor kinase